MWGRGGGGWVRGRAGRGWGGGGWVRGHAGRGRVRGHAGWGRGGGGGNTCLQRPSHISYQRGQPTAVTNANHIGNFGANYTLKSSCHHIDDIRDDKYTRAVA